MITPALAAPASRRRAAHAPVAPSPTVLGAAPAARAPRRPAAGRGPRLRATLALLAGLLPAACASSSGGAPAALPVAVDSAAAGGDLVPFVYVAGYRPEILVFRLDVASGRLTPAGSADGGREPSFLAFHPSARFLYAANEVDDGRVLAFAIDPATGGLTRLNDASSGGVGPAHLSVAPSGRHLLVANYADDKPGTIAVLPVGLDGRLAEAVSRHDFGPATMPHFITTDPTGRFVFVPCKGGPYVAQLTFDPGSGRLAPNQPDRRSSAPQAGPRHLAFHPNRRFAYVINELALTMSAYSLDGERGTLTEIETVPTIPAGVTSRQGFSTADVHVHPSGQFLYGSNRGHDSIVIYRIDPASGRLTLVGHEARGISRPRNFHLEPSGRLLLAANQDAGSVSVFRIDPASGLLEPVGPPTPAGAKPSFVGVVMLPGR